VNEQKTDRELLEAAARAAGINAKWYDVTGCLMRTAAGSGLTRWEPLSNDGDAFRLAVKLRLDICRPAASDKRVCVWVDHMGDFIEEHEGNDPCAATRRAIVRAAAQIGAAATGGRE
jgi:hypothetical protein